MPWPDTPLRSVAELLAAAGERLAQVAVRRLYEGDEGGWFRSAQAGPPIGAWIDTLRSSAVSGDYAPTAAATTRLVRQALTGGATLLECHLFIEAVAAVALRGLTERRAPDTEIVATRRLLGRLRNDVLAHPPT